MSDFSNFLEAAAYNHLFRGVAYVPSGQWWAQIHDGPPGENGVNNVIPLARGAVSFGAPAGRQVASSIPVVFGSIARTASYVSIWDVNAAGNCLAQGALNAATNLFSGGRFLPGDLVVQFIQLLPNPLADVSNYASNSFLGLAFNGTAWATPAGHRIHAYQTNPNPDASGTEMVGTGYAAKTVSWTAPVDGAGDSAVDVEIGPNTTDPAANWPTGNYLACKDGAGNLLTYGSVLAFTLAQGEAQFWEAGTISQIVA